MCFNLLEESWIPILRRNGQFERLGLRRTLTEAGIIRQIAASNPMDNVALLRFLLAVLLWCKDNTKASLATLDDGSTGIPESWLAKLDEYKNAFQLLGDDVRFYQDASVKDNKDRPIADLLVEFPGADSVNHMRHVVHDDSYGFCPACCALGILRLSVWAPANRFYPASVNPGTASYAVAERECLLLTLIANLPEVTALADQAPWLSNAQPDSPGVVANLAWRPRRLWLNVASEQGTCAHCGATGVLIATLCNERGWSTPTTAGRTKKFWEADPQLLKDSEPISLPGLGANAGLLSSRFWRHAFQLRRTSAGRVSAIGPVVNKFTFQDATSVLLPGTSARKLESLTEDCHKFLRHLLKRVAPNPDRQHPEINAAIVMLTPDTEARIRASLIESSATTDATRFLQEKYKPLVDQVVRSTTRGSPLRRRAARHHAQALLSNKIKELVDKANQLPGSTDLDEAVLPKSRRGRK